MLLNGESAMSATQEWHYARGGQQLGPVSSAKLKHLASTGQLSATDLIWKDGWEDWREAASIKGLFQEPVPVPTSYSTLSPES